MPPRIVTACRENCQHKSIVTGCKLSLLLLQCLMLLIVVHCSKVTGDKKDAVKTTMGRLIKQSSLGCSAGARVTRVSGINLKLFDHSLAFLFTDSSQ